MGTYAKALGGGTAGAVTLIGVWLLSLAHVTVPLEVAMAASTLIMGATVYFVPNSPAPFKLALAPVSVPAVESKPITLTLK